MQAAIVIAVIGVGMIVPLVVAVRAYSSRRTAKATGDGYGVTYSFAGDTADSGCDSGAAGDGGCDGGGGGD